jgi:hypothetical protein
MNKRKNTNLSIYGVENAMQNPDVLNFCLSQNFKIKYISIGGKKFSYQGFEHFLLKRLVDKFGSKNVTANKKNMPEIWYRFKGSTCRYFPDMRVGNNLYEVKSEWTFGESADVGLGMFLRLREKANACIEAGYNFRCIVFDRKGKVLLNEKTLDQSFR